MFRSVAAIVVALVALTVPAAASDVGRTFDRAEVWAHPPGLPFFNGRMDDPHILGLLERLPPGTKLPTVVFMHGCSYGKGGAWTYARWLTQIGFVVIIPDSFQRANRPKTCDPLTLRASPDTPRDAVFAMRREELVNAVARLADIPWVDMANLFLMGDDEGGDVVASYDGDAFNAVVISGAACRLGYRVAADTPAMVIASADDFLLAGAAEACTQAATAAGGAPESLVVPGFWHDVSGVVEARPALRDFLLRHMAQR